MGVAGVVRDIVRTRGIAGIFTGLTPTILREAPGNVVYFTSYEIVRYGTRYLRLISGMVVRGRVHRVHRCVTGAISSIP